MVNKSLRLAAALGVVLSTGVSAYVGGKVSPEAGTWLIIGAVPILWIVGIVAGVRAGAAIGWSLWAVGCAVGAAIATASFASDNGAVLLIGMTLLSLVALVGATVALDNAITRPR